MLNIKDKYNVCCYFLCFEKVKVGMYGKCYGVVWKYNI